MKLSIYLVLFSVFASVNSFANTYVKCGQTADADSWTVTGYELELSSEGNDDYTGPVAEKWNLKLGRESEPWMKENPRVTAKNYKQNDNVIVEIRMEESQTPSGPVGTSYKLIGLYSDEPVLEKYTFGGVVGIQKTHLFHCVSAND